MSKKVNLTDEQKKMFNKLWFIYGNNGKHSTLFNHKLIQGFVEHEEDRREDYEDVNKNLENKYGKEYAVKNGITDECLHEVSKILLLNPMCPDCDLPIKSTGSQNTDWHGVLHYYYCKNCKTEFVSRGGKELEISANNK